MSVQEFEVTGHSTATPARVYALLRDGSTWPDWSPLERFELEKPGATEPESVGAIRNFFKGKYKMREQVAELVPDKRFSYVLLEGLPLRDYRADIDITPSAGGADIRWHTSFRSKIPGMGWVYRNALRKLTAEFVDGLVGYTAKG